jgi:hypothetical protein
MRSTTMDLSMDEPYRAGAVLRAQQSRRFVNSPDNPLPWLSDTPEDPWVTLYAARHRNPAHDASPLTSLD